MARLCIFLIYVNNELMARGSSSTAVSTKKIHWHIGDHGQGRIINSPLPFERINGLIMSQSQSQGMLEWLCGAVSARERFGGNRDGKIFYR